MSASTKRTRGSRMRSRAIASISGAASTAVMLSAWARSFSVHLPGPHASSSTRPAVEKLGGRLGRVQQAHQERRAGRQVAAPPTVVWFYELPADALAK